MACPDCGTPVGDIRFVTSVETHGLDCGPFETFHEEFVVCRSCGGRFDLCDWDATPEEACSSPDGENSSDRDCASGHHEPRDRRLHAECAQVSLRLRCAVRQYARLPGS